MGIHHRGAVIHCRRQRDRRVRITVPFAFAVLLILLRPAMGFAQEHKEYKEYHCTPDAQYECTGGQCEKVTEGFQHAESFIYNTRTGMLSACLWTNCYAAKAAVLGSTASEAGTITAIGKLMPTAHPGNEPVIVSLTIHSSDNRDAPDKKAVNFTAVWGYGNKGLTLDTGKCAL
jgi:hypothetical protein